MKIQTSVARPPTLDVAIRKYLIKVNGGIPTYPKVAQLIGYYQISGQYITVYKESGKLVFYLGHLQHGSVPTTVSNTLGNLEKYLRRTEYLSYDDQIILKYTKYWD